MKNIIMLTLIKLIVSSNVAFAVPSYTALTCGDVLIKTQFHATAACKKDKVGPLKGNRDWELGQVYSLVRNTNIAIPMHKTAEAERSIWGSKKGFGVYENDYFILDLTNTADINPQLINFHSQIKLWDKNYRGYITCSISGYHDLSCGSY